MSFRCSIGSIYIYLTAYFGAGLAVLVRALSRARSVTVKRQLRWIVWGTTLGALPFAVGYAIPFALGVDPSLPMGLSAVPLGFVPLAFASAIIRYRLMDVEVILKRLLIYTSAVAAIVAIYVLILRASGGYFVEGENQHRWIIAFLATVVVILLAKPVKDGLQNAIDRAFYRDRYDYRRALVSFARELNSDLDLNRLADRMVTRVRETIELDRMAFLLANADGDFESISHEGLEQAPPTLSGASGIGSRLHSAHTVRLDDPMAATRFTAEEIEFWRDNGLFYFVPCVAKDAAIAVLALGRRASGEPLSTEDTALVTAVAAQAATAIENGRLYRQLHLKASELDRLHAFNENILESLDDGLLVIGPGDNVIRWNASLETPVWFAADCGAGEDRRSAVRRARGRAAERGPQGSSRRQDGVPGPDHGPRHARGTVAARQPHHGAAAIDPHCQAPCPPSRPPRPRQRS